MTAFAIQILHQIDEPIKGKIIKLIKKTKLCLVSNSHVYLQGTVSQLSDQRLNGFNSVVPQYTHLFCKFVCAVKHLLGYFYGAIKPVLVLKVF